VDAVDAFNALPAGQLEDDLRACCAAPAWGSAIIAKRPYQDKSHLFRTAEAASEALTWDDVKIGLSAHPRIGERAAGDSTEAAWSRSEQSAAARSGDEQTAAELIAANRAYEERFGHVFLIFANGRSRPEILAAARERLGNDETTERATVKNQLGAIARLRLERVLDALG
jgi:2-oxo-4-hydroxy-4-carboxy-5-ureidoimidazoline decarboxylase